MGGSDADYGIESSSKGKPGVWSTTSTPHGCHMTPLPPFQRKEMVSWTLSYASGMHVQQSTMSDGSLMTPSVPQRPRARGLLPYVLAWVHQYYHQQRYPRRTIYGHDIIPLKWLLPWHISNEASAKSGSLQDTYYFPIACQSTVGQPTQNVTQTSTYVACRRSCSLRANII